MQCIKEYTIPICIERKWKTNRLGTCIQCIAKHTLTFIMAHWKSYCFFLPCVDVYFTCARIFSDCIDRFFVMRSNTGSMVRIKQCSIRWTNKRYTFPYDNKNLHNPQTSIIVTASYASLVCFESAKLSIIFHTVPRQWTTFFALACQSLTQCSSISKNVDWQMLELKPP